MTQISEIRRDVERMMAMGSDIDKKLTALEERRQEECNDGLEGLPFLEIRSPRQRVSADGTPYGGGEGER